MLRFIYGLVINRVVASLTIIEGRWCDMTVFEAITAMLSFGIFIITLLAYIESRNKRQLETQLLSF